MEPDYETSERRRNKRIVILQVVNPCSFWIKYDVKCDVEHAVNLHYSQHHVAAVQLRTLQKGMNVVVYVKRISLWCRACILGFDKSSFEKLVIVRLIDRGCEESVKYEQIRISLPNFVREEPLAFQLFLPGIRPLTLQMLPDATYSMRRSIEWDPSATIFVKNLITKYKTSFQKLASNGRNVLGNLLFETPEGILDYNENLVNDSYAVFHVEDFETDFSDFKNGAHIFEQSNLAKKHVVHSIPQITLAEKIAVWRSASSSNSEERPKLNAHTPVPRKIIIPNIYNSPGNKNETGNAISQHNIDLRPVEAQEPNYYPAGMLLSQRRISSSLLPAPRNQTVPNNHNGSVANDLCPTGVSNNQAGAVVPLAISSASTVSDIAVPKLLCHLKEKGEPCKASVTGRPNYFSHSLPEQEEDDEFEFVLEYRKMYGKSEANMVTKRSPNESAKCHPSQKSGIREEFPQRHPDKNRLDSQINSSLSRPECSNEPPALGPLPVTPVEYVQILNRNVMSGARETSLTMPLGCGRGYLLPPKPAGVVCELKTSSKVFRDPAAKQCSARKCSSTSSYQMGSSDLANATSFVNGASCTKTVEDKHPIRLQKNPCHYSMRLLGSEDTLLPRGIVDRMTSAKILICGESPRPDEYKSLSSLGCKLLIENLKKLDVFWPNTLQSNVWPAINAKSNIAAICSKSTGRTIAYLAPLLADLMEKKINSHEVSASLPTILVLASSWRQALKIHMQCNVLLDGCSSCRAAVVYGGGSEETQNTAVLNGCDILVSTPPALVRLLEITKSPAVFNLSALRCFVFDDVNVLMMYYMAEIRDVFDNFSNVMKSQMNPRATRRQILAFGTHWNTVFHKFVQTFIPKPTFICSSLCEAAVYSGVTIETHCVTSPDTLQFFLDTFRPQFQSDLTKVVIFTTEIDDAKAIAYALDECCSHVLLAHHEMDLFSVAAICRQWYNGEAVLVTTDTCWAQLDITDAKVLIHYDIPKLAKGIFANRFSCLLEDMHKFGEYSQFPKYEKSDCKVHLLLTEECKIQAHALYLLLARLVSDVPPMLEKVLVNYYLDREANKRTVPLCDSIKALGKCYNKLSCAQRHMVIASVDKPTLNMRSNSLVKVEVTHVKNATHFCGRVMEYIDQSGEKIQRASVNAELLSDLKNRLMPEKRLSCKINPKKGDMYAYAAANGNIHRVVVTRIVESRMIDAIQVDYGDTVSLKLGDLLDLPDDIKQIPPLIHEIFACKLCPKDKDREWTLNANKYVSDLISNTTVTGNVHLALGNTLWIDPIENRVFLSCVKTDVCKWNLRKELLGKFAVENNAHIQDIMKLCENVTNDITFNNETNSIVAGKIEVAPELAMENQWAYVGNGRVDVIVTAGQTPAKFFVRKMEHKNCLDTLLKEINRNPSNSRNVQGFTEFKDNGIYMAQCPSDELWHRVQLIEVVEEDNKEEIKVRFVDVGLECTVKKSVLKMLDEAFLWRLPFQAIECSLSDILHCDKDWNCEASTAFLDMTKDEHGQAKILTARVISKCSSQMAPNANCHFVELYDANISLGNKLCQMGYGKQEINENVDNNVGNGPKENVLANSFLELQKLKTDSSIKENVIDNPINIVEPITFVPQSVQPHVVWSDTKDQLKITILVASVKNYTVTVDERFITFKTLVNNVMNVSHFVTFGKVDPSDKKVVVKDNSVVIVVKKDGTGIWPRLMQDKQKFSWIKFDYDAIVEESSDCELEKNFLKVPTGYNSEILNNSECDDDEDVVLDTDEENDLFNF